MSLREWMQREDLERASLRSFEQWGVFGNPFPAASHTTGHPRRVGGADEEVYRRFREFESRHLSQVLLIQGTQGSGKTNLMNYFEREFRDYYRDDERYYIIRYYPDPEPTFDAVVQRTFQNLDTPHFEKIGRALSDGRAAGGRDPKEEARGHDVRLVLNSLQRAADDEETLRESARLAVEWFTGMRLLRAHRESLGVNFRLDTKESRMQALRDVVYVSARLDLLRGVFLLMDELEKQDYSLTTTPVLRFLLAIRALIDVLPNRLFLMLAMTPAARDRYFAMLPALAGRLQNQIILAPMQNEEQAVELATFYLENARRAAAAEARAVGMRQGDGSPFGRDDADEWCAIFEKQRRRSEERGIKGVTARDFLHRLHEVWAERTGPVAEVA